MAEPKFNENMPIIEHARSASYQVHLASGAVATPMDGRVELSFFADRVKYRKEGLISIDPTDPNLMRPDGQVEATPLREHVAGVSMSLTGLVGLREMINGLISEMEPK